MADLKISQLTDATTPLAGTEVLPIVQSGVTKKVSVDNITAGKPVTASQLTVSNNSTDAAVTITQTGAGNALVVEDSANPDATPFVVNGDGRVGVGANPSAGRMFAVSTPLTGSTTAQLIRADGQIQSDVTNEARGFVSVASTQAASFTIATINHYLAAQGTFGLGSSVTSQFGFQVNPTLIGAANNYGFYSGLASGAGRWNFYAAGTADNYFAGRVAIGTATPNAAALLEVSSTTAGFLPPQMTTAQRDLISTPPNGLMLYNTTTDKLQVRAAGVWVDLH